MLIVWTWRIAWVFRHYWYWVFNHCKIPLWAYSLCSFFELHAKREKELFLFFFCYSTFDYCNWHDMVIYWNGAWRWSDHMFFKNLISFTWLQFYRLHAFDYICKRSHFVHRIFVLNLYCIWYANYISGVLVICSFSNFFQLFLTNYLFPCNICFGCSSRRGLLFSFVTYLALTKVNFITATWNPSEVLKRRTRNLGCALSSQILTRYKLIDWNGCQLSEN